MRRVPGRRFGPIRPGHVLVVATTLHDRHDHHLLTDLLGTVLGLAVGLLLVVAALAAVGVLFARLTGMIG